MKNNQYLKLIKNKPIKSIFDLFANSPTLHPFLEHLLSDILNSRDADLEPLRPWLEVGQPEYKRLLFSPSDLAFDLLLHQPKPWMDDQRIFLENQFFQALVQDNQVVLGRLKALTAEACAGIGPDFLRRLLKKPPKVFSQIEELDIWILQAKLIESKDLPISFNFRQDVGEQIEQHPWLIVVIIYFFREEMPKVALDQLRTWDEAEYEPSKEIGDYAEVYLRHSIYNLLNNGEEENYNWFFSLLYSLTTEPIRNLLQKTLEHELLSKISDECKQRDMTQPANLKRNQSQLLDLFN